MEDDVPKNTTSFPGLKKGKSPGNEVAIFNTKLAHCLNKIVGRDRGARDREKRGREVYGRREKRGREAGFPR